MGEHAGPGGQRAYEVATPPGMPLLWLWAPLLLAMAIQPLVRLINGEPALRQTPADWLPFVLLPLTGLILSLLYRRRRIVLGDGQLDITSTFYRKRVAISAMRLERARIADLAEHTGLKPGRKTNGYQLPGFRSGHFRMRDGGKAFCLVTDNNRVLVLPLHDGSTLLITPEHPRRLLDELQTLAASAPRT